MAIIELGLEARVLIAGSPAPEYPDPEQQSVVDDFAPSAEKCYVYVQCTEDAEFTIDLKLNKPSAKIRNWLAADNHAILFEVDIDGDKLSAVHWVRKSYPTMEIEGIVDRTQGLMHKFRFAKVLTEDDASKSRVDKDKIAAQGLGQIRVRAWRVHDTGHSHASTKPSPSPLAGPLAEKALKGQAISHNTTLSPAVRVRPGTSTTFSWEDPKQDPLAVFYFKYRSKEALQQEMVIPRSRVPSPASADDVESLPLAELHRLAAERLSEIRGRGKRSASIKEEDGEIPHSGRPFKYTRLEDGKKAIDLTEDD